jgi:hypothetical protein
MDNDMKFLSDRSRVAKVIFGLDAVLGVLGIAGAALYGSTFSNANVWVTFMGTFVPFSVLWSLFCYGAYRGLTSRKVVLKAVFWVCVMGNIFVFPIGTAIAGVCIWLWRDFRKQVVERPAHIVAKPSA